jgi:two-component system sensor histidine kinase KdpD
MVMTNVAGRGHLKIYLGYAPGVGKTWRMLDDALHLKSTGVDVAIACLDPRHRSDIRMKADGLECISQKRIDVRGSTVEELDLASTVQRKPKVCLVDDIARTNVGNPLHAKRWEDVEAILSAGIDVWTTMDVAHLECLSEQVWQITGVRVRETVPDWVLEEAAEIVLVDVSPRALLHRLERGAIFQPEDNRPSRAFFKETSLVALRELALLQAAHEVGMRNAERHTSASERILAVVTEHASTAMVLRRARRVADHLDAHCVAVCVHREKSFSDMPAARRKAIERHFAFAAILHIQTLTIQGKNPARALVEWARSNDITQIFVSRGEDKNRWFPGREFLDQLLQEASDLQVTVLGEQRREGKAPVSYAEDVAAGRMNPGFVRLAPDMGIDEAIGEMRRQSGRVEMIYYGYVLDPEQRLLGVVSFPELFSADRSKRVKNVMRTECVSVQEDTACAKITALFNKHKLTAIPVVDSDRQVRGIITTADLRW